MRRWLATFGAFCAAAGAAVAQEGYPLDGTWRGEHAGGTIVVVMQWDGQRITGTINPGPKSIAISDAKLTPEGWQVTMAAKDAAGKPISFAGVLADLGDYHRHIDGTWTEGGRSFKLRMVRE